VAFSYTDFCTTLYFMNSWNYRTHAMQAHALTRTHYFYSLNVIISHLIVQGRTGLSLCMCYHFAVFPSHVCICNCHPGSKLRCVHCTYETSKTMERFCFITPITGHLGLILHDDDKTHKGKVAPEPKYCTMKVLK
jgi:hypothetical protein